MSYEKTIESERGETLSQYQYDYDYPDGLNLKPGSELHGELVDEIKKRARAAHEKVSNRYDDWDETDNVLNAYVDLDAEEKRAQENDKRKPVSVVVPIQFAILDIMVSYLIGAFFMDEPFWRIEGREPNDKYGAKLLELLIQWQSQMRRHALSLVTCFRDQIAYGIGACAPVWDVEYAYKTVRKEQIQVNRWGWPSIQEVKAQEEYVAFEGNRLEAIDPRMILPDPNMPIHEPDQMEFFGWGRERNLMDVLKEEATGGTGIFNARYLQHTEHGSFLFKDTSSAGRSDEIRVGQQPPTQNVSNTVSEIWMYWWLIPRHWKLGPSEEPELWLFCLADDEVIIQARPANLDHNRIPVAVGAPDTDGRSITPLSRLERTKGLQDAVSFLYSTKLTTALRASSFNSIIDPSVINMDDLLNPNRQGIVRTRKSHWGKAVKDAVAPLNLLDATQNHIVDGAAFQQMIREVTGATETISGQRRTNSADVTAAEVRGDRSSAFARMEKIARMMSWQFFTPLGYLITKQTQQLMETATALRVVGRWEEILREQYGNTALVGPFDILVDFDIVARDGTIPNPDNADTWIQLFQYISGNEMLAQQFDTTRIFKHIAHMLGAKDLHQYVVQPQVMQQGQIQPQVQAGNMVPQQEYARATQQPQF